MNAFTPFSQQLWTAGGVHGLILRHAVWRAGREHNNRPEHARTRRHKMEVSSAKTLLNRALGAASSLVPFLQVYSAFRYDWETQHLGFPWRLRRVCLNELIPLNWNSVSWSKLCNFKIIKPWLFSVSWYQKLNRKSQNFTYNSYFADHHTFFCTKMYKKINKTLSGLVRFLFAIMVHILLSLTWWQTKTSEK